MLNIVIVASNHIQADRSHWSIISCNVTQMLQHMMLDLRSPSQLNSLVMCLPRWPGSCQMGTRKPKPSNPVWRRLVPVFIVQCDHP